MSISQHMYHKIESTNYDCECKLQLMASRCTYTITFCNNSVSRSLLSFYIIIQNRRKLNSYSQFLNRPIRGNM